MAWQELEWRRCQASFNYWRDTYAYLKLKSGGVLKWDVPFPCQTLLGDLWQSGESTIDIKTRQNGESSELIHFCAWDCMFHDAVTWNYFGCDEDAGKDALDRLAATLDRLPKWMLERSRITPGMREGLGRQNQRQGKQDSVLSVSFGMSKIRVWTGSVRKAQGLSGKIAWDDAAKHTDKARKWQLMYPALDDPNPENRGQVIIVFNGEGEEFCYHLWQKADMGEVNLKAHFFSWRADPRRTEGEYVGEDGKTHYPWYDNAQKQYLIENPEADAFAFKAQYPETVREAVFMHGNSRFDLACLNAFQERLQDEKDAGIEKWGRHPRTGYMVWDDLSDTPPEFQRHTTGRVRMYMLPDEIPEDVYDFVVGVDAAGGKADSDYCVAMVGAVYTDGTVEQVCVYEAKVEPQDELVVNAVSLCLLYKNALLIPETGSSGHGQAFVNVAKHAYDRIYQAIRTSRFSDDEKLELGFSTDRTSRPALIARLAAALGRRNTEDTAWERDPTLIIHDERTLDELSKFEINAETGKMGAPKGSNDDLVIATGLLLVAAESLAQPRGATSRTFNPNEW